MPIDKNEIAQNRFLSLNKGSCTTTTVVSYSFLFFYRLCKCNNINVIIKTILILFSIYRNVFGISVQNIPVQNVHVHSKCIHFPLPSNDIQFLISSCPHIKYFLALLVTGLSCYTYPSRYICTVVKLVHLQLFSQSNKM